MTKTKRKTRKLKTVRNKTEMNKDLLEVFKQKTGLQDEQIIWSLVSDRNLDFEYKESLLVLTEEKLLVFEADKDEIKEYILADYKKVTVYPQISGGILVLGEGKEGLPLLAFSNTFMKDFYKFKDLLQKKLDGPEEDLKKQDFDAEEVYCPKCQMAYPEKGRRFCPNCIDRRSLFIRVLGYFKPYKWKFVLVMILVMLQGSLGALLPYLSGRVLHDNILNKTDANIKESAMRSFFDAFLGPQAMRALGILILTIFTIRILNQLVGVFQGRLVASIMPRAVLKIKSDIFTALQRLSLSFFNKRQTGSLLNRVQGDADEVLYFFIDGLPYFFVNLLLIVVACAIMLSINYVLAIFALLTIPILFFISYYLIPGFWHLYGKRYRTVRNMSSMVSDNLNGARVVKAFGQQDLENERFEGVNTRVRDAQLDVVDYDNRFLGLYRGGEILSTLIIWGIGSWFVINDYPGMTYGALTAFVAYVTMLAGPLDFMSQVFRWWSFSMNGAQRIFEIIDSVPEIQEIHTPVDIDRLEGEIEIKNISFSYNPDKRVLDNVSFKISAGEYFGIVGKSGAGKTTLINLISRFYDVNEGEILIDGHPIKDLSFETLRRNIAVVSQDSFIFRGSIAENIAFAKPDAPIEKILAAAAFAGAHEFIMKQVHGYDTLVGHGHQELSGGEKQRISIARAILADPAILILDEATASVDTNTELKIQRALNSLVEGRTTISIAHRLSTLKEADSLIVIDKGKVVEHGTHEELHEIKGDYHKLYQMQTKALAMKGIHEHD